VRHLGFSCRFELAFIFSKSCLAKNTELATVKQNYLLKPENVMLTTRFRRKGTVLFCDFTDSFTNKLSSCFSDKGRETKDFAKGFGNVNPGILGKYPNI
jgi:hypothetical protein